MKEYNKINRIKWICNRLKKYKNKILYKKVNNNKMLIYLRFKIIKMISLKSNNNKFNKLIKINKY